MNKSHDRHIDEDRLAVWILESEEEPSAAESAHLDDCPVCRRRVDALRRLEVALGDLDLRATAGRSRAIPSSLQALEPMRKNRLANRVWTLAGLAVAAALAFVVPRVTSDAPLTWSNPRTADLIGRRAVAILTELSPAVADSVVTEMLVRGAPARPPMNIDADIVRLLDVEERETLFQLIRHRLEGQRLGDLPESGGGI